MRQQFTLAIGEVRPVTVEGPPQLEFSIAGQAKQYQLEVNSAYYFGRNAAGRVDMQKIGLDGPAPDTAAVATSSGPEEIRATPPVIDVKIYVDEEEPAVRHVWESRLSKRVNAASAILQKHSGVQLKIVGFGTWQSDNKISEFSESLTEFEEKVERGSERLAIGFTSQFPMARGRMHMAGTRGPLHSHILVREGAHLISESDRLEFLVHELGHFLGATHSPEKTSVMRPLLGDNQAGRPGFRISFDPVNTLIMATVGEQMSRRNVQKFSELPADTKRRLEAIYTTLERSLPDDPASGHFRRLTAVDTASPQLGYAKGALNVLSFSATLNHALVPASTSVAGQPARREGDALTEYLVRQTATAASTLPKDMSRQAFLLALAVGMDDSSTLEQFEATRGIALVIESASERQLRLRMLNSPTIRDRRDIARRFFAAAYLSARVGFEPAKEVLLAHEMARSGGACDFALIAADWAGATFAREVIRGRLPLKTLADGYSPALLMPSVYELPAMKNGAEFSERFGSSRDARFLRQLQIIDERISELPAYRRPGASPGE
jgi:hypothetical protein